MLGNEVIIIILYFDNLIDVDILVIVSSEFVLINEGNIFGYSSRKFGIGMVEIKVVEREG